MLKLIIEDDEGRKTVVPFVRDEITIGREDGNTIRLTERNVSRRHARLLRQNGHVVVEDLGSYNGIRINGERIKGQVPIRDGDLIQIGDYDLAINQENGQPTMAPNAAATAPATAEMPLGTDPAPVLRPSDAAKSAEAGRRDPTAIIRRDKVDGAAAHPSSVPEIANPPKLVIINTEFAGREFPCNLPELTIGRTDENDISVNHRSLSRIHAKLILESTGAWKILDLDSANGMMVNREPYAQATLRLGDIVQLGHVRFQFLAPGDAVTSTGHEDEDTKSSGRWSFLAAVTVALLLAGGLAYYLMIEGLLPIGRPKPLGGANGVEAPVTPSVPVTTLRPAEEATPPADTTRIQQAKEAMTARDFDKAIDLLEPMKLPDGSYLPVVEELLSLSREESAAWAALSLATRHLASGHVEDAEKAIADASVSSAFAKEREELQAQIAKQRGRRGNRREPAAKALPPNEETPATPPAVGEPMAEDAKTLSERGADLMARRQAREAEAVLKKCLEVDPSYPRCHKLLGANYAKLKENEKGAEHYRKFLKLAPGDPDAPAVQKILEAYESAKPKEY